MKKRLGFYGAGEHAWRSHALPGLQTGLFDITAIYDPSAKSAERFQRAIGMAVDVCATSEELVAHPEVDAIMITSPDAFHPKQLAFVVDAGIPVFCEKPMAVTPEGMEIVDRALIQAARNNVLVTTCHPRLENENAPYAWIRHHLGNLQRQYGVLVHVGLDFSYHEPEGDWKQSRSLLLDHWGHEISYLLELIGARAFTATRLVDGPYRYVVAGGFNEGPTFFCMGTRMLEAGHYPETITLRFAKGELVLHTLNGKTVFYDHEKLKVDVGIAVKLSYDDCFVGLMKRFARELESGRSVFSPSDLRLINGSAVTLATGHAELHHFRAN